MWHPGAERTATLKGCGSGQIASILVSDLPAFVAEFSEVGIKLMRSELSGARTIAIHSPIPAHRIA